MKKERGEKISNAVIRRLPRYYRHLNELYQAGRERISSKELGITMGLTASQIRQDLSRFGEFGQQGYGYNVENLRDEIADILGINQGNTAVVLGAGNLGRALIGNFHFDRSGVTLTAAFDTSEALVGSTYGGIPIYHVDQLDEYLKEHPTAIGVITVPRDVAEQTAVRLIAGGVKGVWNFTSMDLRRLGADVVIENVHFSDSLRALSYLVSEAK